MQTVPWSQRFGDFYFSRDGALEESKHVFIQGNRLLERWQALHGGEFSIGELGFGFGRNFLVTWKLWSELSVSATLNYTAIEQFVPDLTELEQCYASWPSLEKFSQQLLTHLAKLDSSNRDAQIKLVNVVLRVINKPVHLALTEMENLPPIDAWYFDGFAPDRNSEMWSEEVMRQVKKYSAPQATFATYSSAASVKNCFTNVGFSFELTKGFGQKKRMLRGFI